MLGRRAAAAALLLSLLLSPLMGFNGAEARHGGDGPHGAHGPHGPHGPHGTHGAHGHRPEDPSPEPAEPSEPSEPTEPATCESARLKCAFRTGCGRALQSYMLSCPPALLEPDPGAGPGQPRPAACPENCQHALIALTSTEEGKDLMTCKCTDEYCEETKRRTEVCRPHVERATLNETIVSCEVAQWICKADALCSTALDFYHRLCRPMFRGKRCSKRCSNSISILRRQEKAQKLISCRCDGRDDDDCAAIRHNMGRLCFPEESESGQGNGNGDEQSVGRQPPSEGVAHPPPAYAPPRAAAPAAAPASAPRPLFLVAPAAALLLALYAT